MEVGFKWVTNVCLMLHLNCRVRETEAPVRYNYENGNKEREAQGHTFAMDE
jgi:hypothetical protein